MGTASTGESVLLISVKTEFRGGIGSWVKYKRGSDTVESMFSCPVSKSDGRPHFSDQGVRYASSTATEKVLSIACSYHKFISDKYGHLYETSP